MFSRFNVICLAVYLLAMTALICGLVAARRRVLETSNMPQAREAWQQWREEADRQSRGGGPVHRRAPKSGEPPALVLLRDHFATCLAGLVLISSALFFALAFLIRGVAMGPTFQLPTHE